MGKIKQAKKTFRKAFAENFKENWKAIIVGIIVALATFVIPAQISPLTKTLYIIGLALLLNVIVSYAQAFDR